MLDIQGTTTSGDAIRGKKSYVHSLLSTQVRLRSSKGFGKYTKPSPYAVSARSYSRFPKRLRTENGFHEVRPESEVNSAPISNNHLYHV